MKSSDLGSRGARHRAGGARRRPSAGRRRRVAERVAVAGTVTLRIGTTSDADTINPFTMLETLSFETVTLTYNLLFYLGLDGKPTPQLAAEIPTQENGGISADGKTVTVKLKPDLKWSDGTPLTADDVAWTYNYYVDNADVLANMALGAMGIKHTIAVDERRCASSASGRRRTSCTRTCRCCPSTSGRTSRRRRPAPATGTSPPLVGSGPFLIAEWKPGSYLRLERNPVLRRRAGGRRDRLRGLPERRDDGLRPSDRRPRCGAGDPPRPVPGGEGPAGHHRHRLQLPQLGLPLLQLLRHARLLGQSGAARPQVPAGAQLGHRPREAGGSGVQRLRHGRHDGHAAGELGRSGLPLAAARRPALLVRPRQGGPASRRCRLRQGQRRPAAPGRQADRAALLDAHRQRAGADGRQDDGRLVPASSA